MNVPIEEKTTEMVVVVERLRQIATRGQFEEAGQRLREVVALKDEVNATFGPIVKKANDAHKEAISQRKKHLEVPERLEKLLKGARGEYVRGQELKAAEERRRLEAASREKAEAERKEREAEARLQAEAAAAARAEVLRLEGDEAAAREALEAPIVVDVPEVVPIPVYTRTIVPEQKGFRDNWDYTITKEATLKAWLWDLYPGLLLIDESGVRTMVKHLKEEAGSIPGISVTCVKVESVRR